MNLIKLGEIENKIFEIKFNNPDQLNAMTEEMSVEFRDVVDKLRDKGSKVIILTGEGRAFSAGGNLEMLKAKAKLSKSDNKRIMLDFYNSFLSILSLDVPVIAAINGHAVGAGMCLATACDIRVAARQSKLGYTFTRLGLHPGMGATFFLPKVVGRSCATELLLTAKIIGADEAYRVGLVSKIVEVEDINSEALKLAKEIIASGPLATKQLVQTLRASEEEMKKALEREADCQAINYADKEFFEGVSAIIEKRSPVF